MLFGALTKSRFTPLVASLISAGIFALFHFEPKRFLVLFVIGAVLGEARRRSGSTLASVVAHMVNNAPAVVSLFGVHIALIGY
jgi:membrane protease YdiL (CAAX protease family)